MEKENLSRNLQTTDQFLFGTFSCQIVEKFLKNPANDIVVWKGLFLGKIENYALLLCSIMYFRHRFLKFVQLRKSQVVALEISDS